MDITTFLILLFANWRLTNLASDPKEDGPAEILPKIRRLAGVRFDQNSKPYGTWWGAEAMMCPWCVSIWWGGLQAIGWYFWPNLTTAVCLVFALSAATVLIHEKVLKP